MPGPLTIAKPTFFLGKPEEDAQEWIENFENIAIANGWDDNKKLQVIPVYLLETAKRWLDEARPNIIAWTGIYAPVPTTFKYKFLKRFGTDQKKAAWIREFQNLKQGKNSIETYIDEFTRLYQKVDPTGAWTEEMKVRRFVDGLNSRLTPLVHMKNPQDLEEAFDAASRAATGFDLGKKADAEISLAEQVEALQVQIVELTTGIQPVVNCAMPTPNPPTNPFVNYQQPYHQPEQKLLRSEKR